MRRRRGLADAALEVGHRQHLRRQALGPIGQVVAAFGPLGGKKGAKPQDVVQGEPLGATLAFVRALRQIRVLPQYPAEMSGRHGDQVLGDLPGRELPERLLPSVVESAACKVVPTATASPGNRREAFRVQGTAQSGERMVRGQSVIGSEGVAAHQTLHVTCFSLSNKKHMTWEDTEYVPGFFSANLLTLAGLPGAEEQDGPVCEVNLS